MYDGLTERTGFGTFRIDMNPLVVECGISECVDAVLVYLEPFRFAKFLAYVLFKFFVRVDGKYNSSYLWFIIIG